MTFRNDINALRALAVSLVILFHFKVSGFESGFIGVDIFFVISGFLMTGIIISKLQNTTFSLLDFYQHRARRIIPALALLCAALLAFGIYAFPNNDLRSLIRDIKSSLLFFSNFELAKSGDYFQAPINENWLLHTWSLSVEWQFYLIYPLILLGLRKFARPRTLPIALGALFILSYTLSCYLTPIASAKAFYLLPTRAFEMLAGGLAFLMKEKISAQNRNYLLVSGYAAIALSVAILQPADNWPGYLAILPVAGAALLILAAVELRIYRIGVVQWLGKISYSAYLWHWPIVVVLYFMGRLNNPSWIAGGIGLTLILANFSYLFVEQQFKPQRLAGRSILKYMGFTVSFVIVASLVSALAKSYPDLRAAQRDDHPPIYKSRLHEETCPFYSQGTANCIMGKGPIRAIVIGDSHAQATAAALQLDNPEAAIVWAQGGCPLLEDFEMRDKKDQALCQSFVREKLKILATEYKGVPVVLFNRYSLYRDPTSEHYISAVREPNTVTLNDAYSKQFRRTVCAIAHDHPVFLVKPIPTMPFNVYKATALQKRLLVASSDFSIPIEDYYRANATALQMLDDTAKACGAQLIDPIPRLCPNGKCLGALDGKPLYVDDNHLVDAGNLLLKGLFKPVFQASP
ncbi:hypothetical protein SB11R_10060 [Pseudomonas oryzihabitans]|nr:hypothetical protein SB11R_10060 [Pseudomonas psychrotolerans]